MRRFNLLLFLCLMAGALSAQFVNNGATVTIQAGATLRVETDFTNTSGTITNLGTLEVQGNFVNDPTNGILSSGTGLVKFIGATASTVNTGGDALHNVEMAKTASATTTLLAAASMSGNLSFTGTGSKLALGNFDLTMTAPASTVTATTNHTTNGCVATTGTGKLIKSVVAGSISKVMEIGDATNYTPVTVSMTGNAAGNVSANVITLSLSPKYDDASDKLNREWIVSTPTVTSSTLTGTYIASPSADVTGTQSLIKGCTYLGSNNWSFSGSAGSGNTVAASTTTILDIKLSGQNFFGKANLKAYLAGALPSGTTMTTTLNAALLPTTETPYTAAPFSAPSLAGRNIVKPANATDWILVEVRDAITPATVISQTSGWILNDGTIVSYDNTPLRLKNAVASGHIAIRHRNHLSIRTATSLDLINPPALKDFSLGTSEAYTNPAFPAIPYSNANMRLIGSVYAMWGGNANANTNIRYAGLSNDNSTLLLSLGGNTANIISNTYNSSDLNLNGVIRYAGLNNDNAVLLSNLDGNTANIYTQH